MLLTNSSYRIFASVAAAEKVAAANAEAGDGWEYRVVADPKGSGRAIIEVYDEDGEKLGLL